MKSKKYIPLSRQAKANNLKNLWSITFWLLFFVVSAVLANFLLTQVFNTSLLAQKINGNTQLMYTTWSIQATVTVLSFFISNIMTSIVKDVFYGLSIKDILTARVKWHEISFWHQSIMSILLVILNLPFVLTQATASVVVLAIINLLFIVYMMNNAFSYVFNSKVIVNRVDKLITKEILTNKTILDLKVFITSLENDTLRRINTGELRKASYNIYFLLRMYETLTENTKKEEVKLLLKTLNKLVVQLVKTNNFEPLNYILSTRIENTLTNEEFSELTCNLIENVTERFINYTTLDIKDNKIDEQIIKWSTLKQSDNHIDSISSSFFNYYNSILLNAKITKPTKSKLLNQVFNALTHPEENNKGQQEAFKIALMNIVKDMILNNNELEFKQLLKTLNTLEKEQSPYSQEVMALVNTYVYYLTFNKNVSGKIPKRANEFLHMQPDTMELDSKTLADMLKESNARYIKHFWSVVETIATYNTNEKLSISRNHLDFNEKIVTKFYLTYWKMFANSLENINLNLSEENEQHYKLTLLSLIQNVKEDEDKDYSIFKNFCEVYKIDYEQLKEQEKWVKNADKIDEYIRDVYLEHLTNSTLNTISRLNLTGTLKQEMQLFALITSISQNLPLYKDSPTDTGAKLTLPFVFNVNSLKNSNLNNEVIKEYSAKFKQTLIDLVKELLSDSEIEVKTYNKEEANLKQLLKIFDAIKTDTITHNLSNNLDVLNNDKDEEFIPKLIEKEHSYNVLDELEFNEYLFINSQNSSINIHPISARFRKPTNQEVEEMLLAYKTTSKKSQNDYKIEHYYGTKEQAVNYYSSLYFILDVEIEVVNNLHINSILKVEIK